MSDRASSSATHHRAPSPRGRPAFTLIELMVVIGIIILVVAIALPAVGPMLNSNQQAQAIMTLSGALTIAQSAAENSGADVVLRIERGFKATTNGAMLDRFGVPADNPAFDATSPAWEDYQQIRYLRASDRYLEDIPSLMPVKLPKGAWLAPNYAVIPAWFDNASFNDPPSYNPSAFPGSPPTSSRVKYSPLDTFYLSFTEQGSLSDARFVAGPPSRYDSSTCWAYADQTLRTQLGVVPITPHPHNSARGVLVYDRPSLLSWQVPQRRTFLQSSSRPFFVNRYMGSLVEGRLK